MKTTKQSYQEKRTKVVFKDERCLCQSSIGTKINFEHALTYDQVFFFRVFFLGGGGGRAGGRKSGEARTEKNNRLQLGKKERLIAG